jgi:hypothetical protein
MMIDKNEAMLTAIEVVTAWTDSEDNTEFVAQRASQHTAGPDDGLTLTTGLISLCGVLLFNLAKLRGASGEATAEEQREILRELALRVERRQGRDGG